MYRSALSGRRSRFWFGCNQGSKASETASKLSSPRVFIHTAHTIYSSKKEEEKKRQKREHFITALFPPLLAREINSPVLVFIAVVVVHRVIYVEKYL
jgi:hypothetical protein